MRVSSKQKGYMMQTQRLLWGLGRKPAPIRFQKGGSHFAGVGQSPTRTTVNKKKYNYKRSILLIRILINKMLLLKIK